MNSEIMPKINEYDTLKIHECFTKKDAASE